MLSQTISRNQTPEIERLPSSLKPIDINEDEELERITAMVQRDSLIRSLGIIEMVHRILHYNSGTTTISNTNLPQVFCFKSLGLF